MIHTVVNVFVNHIPGMRPAQGSVWEDAENCWFFLGFLKNLKESVRILGMPVFRGGIL